MKKNWSILIAITVLLTQSVNGLCSEETVTNPSPNNRIAKRKGIFVAPVQITPDEFEWKGHKFKVHDAWLETVKNAKPLLLDNPRFCFTFKVDGKRPAEAPPEVAKDLTFREDSGVYWCRTRKKQGSFGVPNHACSIIAIIPSFIIGKFPVHYIDAKPDQKQIELHICDRSSSSFNEKEPPQPTEPVLSLSVMELKQ